MEFVPSRGWLNEDTQYFRFLIPIGQKDMWFAPRKVGSVPFLENVLFPIVEQNDRPAHDVDKFFLGVRKRLCRWHVHGDRHQNRLDLAKSGTVCERFVQVAHFLATKLGGALAVRG